MSVVDVDVDDVADDAEVNAPAVPLSTPVGTPPAIAYVHRCTDIAAHRQT